jgi:hypothetical protein
VIRKSFTALALFLLLAGTAICQDVRYNFDKDANFSKFKTYKWVEIKDASKMDSLMEKQMKGIVDSVLATKGLTVTDLDSADIYIAYQAAIGSEKQFTSFNSGWGYGGGWYGGGWYGGGGMSTTTGSTTTIYTGQLTLDMYDPANKDLIWRGVVSKTIDQKAKPEKQQKNMTKAINKLLKNYPPEVKK